MSILGTWDVTVETPFGSQQIALQFSDEHSGTASYGATSLSLENVVATDDRATCGVTLTQPMSVKLRCTVESNGDALTGTASAGFFGKFRLSGSRAA